MLDIFNKLVDYYLFKGVVCNKPATFEVYNTQNIKHLNANRLAPTRPFL